MYCAVLNKNKRTSSQFTALSFLFIILFNVHFEMDILEITTSAFMCLYCKTKKIYLIGASHHYIVMIAD